MKIAVIITTNEVEKAWNAFRLMNASLEMGHTVSVFLMNGGVEIEFMDHEFFDIAVQFDSFLSKQGKILSCGTCLQFRKLRDQSHKTTIATMIDCVTLIEESDRVLTF